MRTTSSFIPLILAALVNAAYVPSEPWSTLTPSNIGKTTDYTHTFAIAIQTISNSTTTSSEDAPAASATNSAVISQIGDGQIQATTSTAEVVSQIGDGQIQATTSTAEVVSQIGDGQIQATTAVANTTTAEVVSQIGDGQIQATTSTAEVVSQIGDGQIQATTSTAEVVSQIGDGQIQATTSTTDVASQISDGQIQATSSAATLVKRSIEKRDSVTCKNDNSLMMTLENSILYDAKGRIGSIVANRQFQFDGPPPQAGAIYAAGWSVDDGYLTIGDEDVFYQCLSGNFYNLYDEHIGSECYPVHLKVVDVVDC